jgi:alkaline phosphatase
LAGENASSSQSLTQTHNDQLKAASELGWNVQDGINDFQNINKKTKFPLMNLFALDHMDFEIDRDPKVQPSLKEMAIMALELLSVNSKNGFFLMIEGSRIDMAAHRYCVYILIFFFLLYWSRFTDFGFYSF